MNQLRAMSEAGKGFRNTTVFTILTLYLSTALFQEFGDAVGLFLGPAIGTIVATIAFLWYADKKHKKEIVGKGVYNRSERSTVIRNAEGKLEELDQKGEDDTSFKWILYLILSFVVFGSELTWANVLF